MRTNIVDPGLLGILAAFYNQTCTIMAYAETINDSGSVTRTWSNVDGETDIPCRIAPKSAGGEIRQPNQTYSYTEMTITLAGNYPDVVAQNRAVVGGVNYDILGTRVDSFNVSTVLDVKLVPGSVVS